MFNKKIVQNALERSWAIENNSGWKNNNHSDVQGSLTSKLIQDIFGGEILKTHNHKSWHFYNRINGERFDFTKSDNYCFEDLLCSPDETYDYFEQEEYSTQFNRFIRAYEEAVGL